MRKEEGTVSDGGGVQSNTLRYKHFSTVFLYSAVIETCFSWASGKVNYRTHIFPKTHMNMHTLTRMGHPTQ